MNTLSVPRLELNGLSKDFPSPGGGRIHAVREVTLAVEDAELLAIVGPSASGKTTLLRLIAGLEDPMEGRILLGDREITTMPTRQRNVSMVFQTLALFPHLTAKQNIGLGLKLQKTPRAEIVERTQEMASRLGITACLDRHPAALSAGQRQRVALARALIRKPSLLLLDEPFSHVDRHLRAQLCREVSVLHGAFGLTTLLVTHDLTEATRLGNRIAVMNEGRLEQVGTPAALHATPTTPFVAEFLRQDEPH